MCLKFVQSLNLYEHFTSNLVLIRMLQNKIQTSLKIVPRRAHPVSRFLFFATLREN